MNDISALGKDIKLVVSDLDGTLLTPEEIVPPEFFDLFEEMDRRGITFVAASGRQYYNLLKNFRSIADRIYFISENGAYAVHQGEELWIKGVPPEEMRDIIVQGRQMDNPFMLLCGKRSAYIERQWSHLYENARNYYDRIELVDDLLTVDNDVFLKLAVYDPLGASSNGMYHFSEWSDTHNVTVSGNVWLDVMSREADKSVPLRLIQQRLGISPDQTIAFGDQMNDCEMLRMAKYGYAMENASPELRATTSLIAPGNGQKGVIQVLRETLALRIK